MLTRQPIIQIDKLVFVNLDANGLPAPHGKTGITYIKYRLQIKEMSGDTASNNAVGSSENNNEVT
jgi:hypothetical protein